MYVSVVSTLSDPVRNSVGPCLGETPCVGETQPRTLDFGLYTILHIAITKLVWCMTCTRGVEGASCIAQ